MAKPNTALIKLDNARRQRERQQAEQAAPDPNASDAAIRFLGELLSASVENFIANRAPRPPGPTPLRPAIRRELQERLEGGPAQRHAVEDAIVSIMQGVELLAETLGRSEPTLEMRIAIASAAVELSPTASADSAAPPSGTASPTP